MLIPKIKCPLCEKKTKTCFSKNFSEIIIRCNSCDIEVTVNSLDVFQCPFQDYEKLIKKRFIYMKEIKEKVVKA